MLLETFCLRNLYMRAKDRTTSIVYWPVSKCMYTKRASCINYTFAMKVRNEAILLFAPLNKKYLGANHTESIHLIESQAST